MPIPLSLTFKNRKLFSFCEISLICTIILPNSGVYFMALETRLDMTEVSLSPSKSIINVSVSEYIVRLI